MDVHRQLDKMENECRPAVSLDQNTLNFGDIYFNTPKTMSITIENPGKVFAQFQFIPKLNQEYICKPWLSISNPNGIIVAGEKQTINFKIHINKLSAPPLNLGTEKLEEILILNIHEGDDHFVSYWECVIRFFLILYVIRLWYQENFIPLVLEIL